MEAVGPWVGDCIRLMDSEGSYGHFKYDGQLGDQPALDMQVFDAIRSRWCELRNDEMEKKYGQKTASNHRR